MREAYIVLLSVAVQNPTPSYSYYVFLSHMSIGRLGYLCLWLQSVSGPRLEQYRYLNIFWQRPGTLRWVGTNERCLLKLSLGLTHNYFFPHL